MKYKISLNIWLWANLCFALLLIGYYSAKGMVSIAFVGLYIAALITLPVVFLYGWLLKRIEKSSISVSACWFIIIISVPLLVLVAFMLLNICIAIPALWQQLVPGTFFFDAIISGYFSIACNFSSINKLFNYES